MYQEFEIPTSLCITREELVKHLYENYYDSFIHINENGSLTYHFDTKGNFYVRTNLYCDLNVFNLDLNEYDYEKKNLKQYFLKDKLPLYMFRNIINYLEEWTGEYGDSILDIKKNNDNSKWCINCRIEF